MVAVMVMVVTVVAVVVIYITFVVFVVSWLINLAVHFSVYVSTLSLRGFLFPS